MPRRKFESPLICEPCRARKLKCDGGEPECANCLRVGTRCFRRYQGHLPHVPAQVPGSTSSSTCASALVPVAGPSPLFTYDISALSTHLEDTRIQDTGPLHNSVHSAGAQYIPLQGADARDTNFGAIGLGGEHFQGTEFWGTNFQAIKTHFQGAGLRGTDLQEAEAKEVEIENISRNSGPVVLSSVFLNQAQILSNFIYEFIPKKINNVDPHQMFSWVEFFPQQHGKWKLMDIGMEAISLIFLGTKHSDLNLIVRSWRRYSRVVRQFSEVRTTSEDIIAMATALSIFEVYNPSREFSSWTVHVRAMCRLLEQWGPNRPIDPRLLCLVKTLALYDACGRRKATFLDKPEWRVAPPREEPFEQVLDISLSLPTIQQYRDRIQLIGPYWHHDTQRTLSNFLRVFRKTYTQLRYWYLNFLHRPHRDCPFTVRYAYDTDLLFLANYPHLRHVFRDMYEFPDKHQWQLLLKSWTGFFILFWEASEVMKALNTIIDGAYSPWAPSDPSNSHPSPEANPAAEPHSWLKEESKATDWPCNPDQDLQEAIRAVDTAAEFFAVRICRCMAYCDKFPSGCSIKTSTLSPLWIVQQFFKDRSRERWSWCQAVVECFPSKEVGFGCLLSKMDYNKYRSLEGHNLVYA